VGIGAMALHTLLREEGLGAGVTIDPAQTARAAHAALRTESEARDLFVHGGWPVAA
jgi:hypothetical protein